MELWDKPISADDFNNLRRKLQGCTRSICEDEKKEMHMRDVDASQEELTGFSDRMWKRESGGLRGALWDSQASGLGNV